MVAGPPGAIANLGEVTHYTKEQVVYNLNYSCQTPQVGAQNVPGARSVPSETCGVSKT